MQPIKNIAIVAHVDHGKTTLVDAMLGQSGVFRANQHVQERVMDSNDLERERGITIFSKNAAFEYKGTKINIVDTPGHADFGGEVQRILKMVDSVLLLVDAFEGPMPQTKYVLKNALELGIRPVVVINKIDRPNGRPDAVVDMVLDLFIELNADDDQLDFPVVFASAKDGVAHTTMGDGSTDLTPLFDAILSHVPDAEGDQALPLQLLISAISYDNYLGKIGTGKIVNGSIGSGDDILLLKRDGSRLSYRITRVFAYEGLKRKAVDRAFAGDIVSVAGMGKVDLGETAAHQDNTQPLPLIKIDETTLSLTFTVNAFPFDRQEWKLFTFPHL